MADEMRAYVERAMDEDANIHTVYTDQDGNTVALVDDDAPEVLAPYATRAPGVIFSRAPRFTAPPPGITRETGVHEPLDYIDPEDKHRPPFAGISYGHYQVSAGTLGFVMQSNGKQVGVSNNHVLALVNRGAIGSPILQPGTADGGTQADKVAELAQFVRLENNVTVDAAKAETTIDHDLYILGIGYLNGITPAVDGQKIWKAGRTTEVSAGRILGSDVTAEVSYGNMGTYKLKDLIITNMVSAGGDSGSGVLDFGSNRGVGLLFAGNGMLTLCCKLSNAAQLLSLQAIPAPKITRSLWLDISHWQGDIHAMSETEAKEAGFKANLLDLTPQSFNQMKAMGVRGVIMKVCQGDYSIDDKFYQYYEYAGQAGLLRMGYTFVDPKASADAHYQYFINAVGERRFDWPVVLDMEIEGGQNASMITSIAQRLVTLFNGWQGKNPFIYSNLSFANKNFLPWSGWGNVPLHLALWLYDDGMYPIVPNVWQGADGKALPGKPELWQFEVNQNGPAWGVSSQAVDMDTTNSAFEALRLTEEPPPPDTVTLTISIEGEGFVLPSGGTYPVGEVVQLYATAEEGWRFVGWGGDAEGSLNPLTVTMDVSKYIIATFERQDGGGGGPKEFTHYQGVTKVRGQNIRIAPTTAGNSPVGVLDAGQTVRLFAFVEDAQGNTWANIGWDYVRKRDLYAAVYHNGTTYIEVVM